MDERAARAPLVAIVRQRIAHALLEQDYRALVRLLAQLVAGVPEPSR